MGALICGTPPMVPKFIGGKGLWGPNLTGPGEELFVEISLRYRRLKWQTAEYEALSPLRKNFRTHVF